MFIKVETTNPYGIIIERNSIDKVGEIVSKMYKPGTKAMIVSDVNVFPIYGHRVIKSLEASGISVKKHISPAGEEIKNLNTISEIYKSLADNSFTRTDIIIALGGGVIGDMAGFAAATYLRGVDYIQIPTSLLAQVDSSVGGKTAVDLPHGKNLVGAFHQPKAVICDPSVLKTLPEEYFIDGLGEVVKYACIDDVTLFEELEKGYVTLDNIDETIYRCIDCKRKFVEEDTEDKGVRMILNFGHTFGHAIEKLHGFSTITHGRAVAIGMNIACVIGEYMNYTEKGTAERLRNVLTKLGLPTSDYHSLEEILDATNIDKKSVGKMINLIFISNIGKAMIKQEERNYLVLKLKILMEQKGRDGKNSLY